MYALVVSFEKNGRLDPFAALLWRRLPDYWQAVVRKALKFKAEPSGHDLAEIACIDTVSMNFVDPDQYGEKTLEPVGTMPGLVSIRMAALGRCSVSLAPLSRLKDLNRLSLSNFATSEESCLGQLQSLQHLSLRDGSLCDLSVLAESSALKTLSLSDLAIEQIAPLGCHPSLVELEVGGTAIESLDGVQELQALLRLEARGNVALRDVSMLSDLPQLQEIDLGRCLVSDLSAIQTARELKVLNLEHCPVHFRTLGNLKLRALKSLVLNWTGLADLDVVAAAFPNLMGLHCLNTMVTDLSPLAGCSSLGWLRVSGQDHDHKISGLKQLEGLPQLRTIEGERRQLKGLAQFLKARPDVTFKQAQD